MLINSRTHNQLPRISTHKNSPPLNKVLTKVLQATNKRFKNKTLLNNLLLQINKNPILLLTKKYNKQAIPILKLILIVQQLINHNKEVLKKLLIQLFQMRLNQIKHQIKKLGLLINNHYLKRILYKMPNLIRAIIIIIYNKLHYLIELNKLMIKKSQSLP